MECLLNDGNEHVGGHGTPNFRLELVLAVAQNCLIHLKNNSTCQRLLYKAAMVKGGKAVLLVRKTKVCLVVGSLNRIRPRCSGYS